MAAITNYSTLQTEIEANLHRSDISSATIQGFIDLAETRLREDLMVREMETAVDVTISAQTASLPTGYVGIRRFYLNTSPTLLLTYLTPDVFWSTYASSQVSRPIAFTIEGENFVFGPTPDATYTGKALIYSLIALATTDPSALLTSNPNLYLYAGTLEAAIFLDNDRLAEKYGLLYREALKSKKKSSRADRTGSQALRARPISGVR
jgi:hypothetical protein|tara:strand:- start:4480 stop:5100 length:621 start_codon:yes stop_codon:yes gene_type:complete